MTIFYISIYLIITVLLNDAIKFCSKIPLSDDSCRTEICRTCRSTGVCAMGVFTGAIIELTIQGVSKKAASH